MQLGIKVGLQHNSTTDLETARPDFCEFWFHSGKIDEYDELFSYCAKKSISTGLHFWGALTNGTLANIAYPDTKILKESRRLVYKTIDAAAKNKSRYVNMHPGGAMLSKIDFDKSLLMPYGKAVSYEQSAVVCEESLQLLSEYAQKRGIMLLVESVPMLSTTGISSQAERLHPINLFELPIRLLEPVFHHNPNLYFANDLGHTLANFKADRTTLVQNLTNITKRLFDTTKLLHVSFIIPPYNGTDYHGCLYDREFKTAQAIPNYDEMKSLLAPFTERSDVGALVEPRENHPRNFFELKKLISEIAKNPS
ncbi:hypothetical protein C4579_02800 [Candidatus Microgenomates bacterium]|nr:MAG: hypothetical protein C4579_02800 [Candidatus Microgenomates bacterium]